MKSHKSAQKRARKLFGAAIVLAAIGTGTAGCVTTQYPVNSPCGVIVDSLKSVRATTRSGNERLAIHFERGVKAGCWTREDVEIAKRYIR